VVRQTLPVFVRSSLLLPMLSWFATSSVLLCLWRRIPHFCSDKSPVTRRSAASKCSSSSTAKGCVMALFKPSCGINEALASSGIFQFSRSFVEFQPKFFTGLFVFHHYFCNHSFHTSIKRYFVANIVNTQTSNTNPGVCSCFCKALISSKYFTKSTEKYERKISKRRRIFRSNSASPRFWTYSKAEISSSNDFITSRKLFITAWTASLFEGHQMLHIFVY